VLLQGGVLRRLCRLLSTQLIAKKYRFGRRKSSLSPNDGRRSETRLVFIGLERYIEWLSYPKFPMARNLGKPVSLERAKKMRTLFVPWENHTSCKANPITFKRTHQSLPLPNPDSLRIHALCCRVAHLSGASGHMDQILADLEDMQILFNDGSSAHVLSFALQPYSQEDVF
jgi:hypothetical protein